MGGRREEEGRKSVYLKTVNRYWGEVEKQRVLYQYKASLLFFFSFPVLAKHKTVITIKCQHLQYSELRGQEQ